MLGLGDRLEKHSDRSRSEKAGTAPSGDSFPRRRNRGGGSIDPRVNPETTPHTETKKGVSHECETPYTSAVSIVAISASPTPPIDPQPTCALIASPQQERLPFRDRSRTSSSGVPGPSQNDRHEPQAQAASDSLDHAQKAGHRHQSER